MKPIKNWMIFCSSHRSCTAREKSDQSHPLSRILYISSRPRNQLPIDGESTLAYHPGGCLASPERLGLLKGALNTFPGWA